MTLFTYDVAILGAGIVGAACARALGRVGMRVAVLDRAPVGSGATAAGMGHIVVLDDSEAQFALTHYSQQLWDELSDQLPAEVEYVKTGTLWVAADDEEMQAVHAKHQYYHTRGVPTEILDARGVADAEPNLRAGLHGGLRVPGESVVYPPCAAHWLIEQAQSNGAALHCETDVVGWDGTRLQCRDGSVFACGQIVHATGAWSAALLPELPIRSRKGHLLITDRYPGFVRHQIVELGYLKSAHAGGNESVAFNLQPRKTGQLLLGSSRQYDVVSREVEPHMVRRMLACAMEYMPRLAHLSALRTWTGFRAATPDSLPLVGPLPSHANHFLATGHEGLGITTSLATAELIVAHLTGQTAAIAGQPYLPSRFHGGIAHE